MRVGKWHILGPESHVSLASLVGRILAVAMKILNHECGPFWPNFSVFPIVCHIETTISHWGKRSSQYGSALLVAYDQGLNALESVCSSGPSGVIQLLVRSMIPPFAPHAAFCPIRVFIPSMNSKQPAWQQAITQGMGPEGISRVVNQGLVRQDRQGFLPWTVARDDRFCHFCNCGPNLDGHYAKWHGDLWEPRAWESPLDSWWMACGMADLTSKPAWRYTIRDTFAFGSF